MRAVHIALLGLLLLALPARAQQIAPAWADSVIEQLAGHPIEDHEGTLPLARSLLKHFGQRKDTCRMAEASVALASCYDAVGKLDSALVVILNASNWMDHDCGKELPFRVALNLSAVYLSLEEFDRADSICSMALGQLTSVRTSVHQSDLIFNRAVALASQGDLKGADAQFAALEKVARANGDAVNEIDAMLNRGALLGMQEDLDGAKAMLQRALERCRETDCPMRAIILQNLASVAGDQGRPKESMVLLDSAFLLAKATGDLQLQVHIVGSRALNPFVHVV